MSYGKTNMRLHTEGTPIEHKIYKYNAEYFKATRYYYRYFALGQSPHRVVAQVKCSL